MGREDKRRELKNNKNKSKKEKEIETELETSIKPIEVLKLGSVIILLLFVMYYVIAVFVTKELSISTNNDNNTTEQTNSDISTKILASNMFNQAEDEYYVYFYDFNKEDNMLANLTANIMNIPIYKVDTSSSLNAKYVTEEETGNKDATKIQELKVKNPTIIKIKNNKIVGYYEGANDIYKKLKDEQVQSTG